MLAAEQRAPPAIGMSNWPDPVLTRASSWLEALPVLNIAQTLLKLSEKPACWKVAAPKVASNSSARPEAKVASVPA